MEKQLKLHFDYAENGLMPGAPFSRIVRKMFQLLNRRSWDWFKQSPLLFSSTVMTLLLIMTMICPVMAVSKTLLPEPQKVQYGKGQLSLLSVSIRVTSEPAAEDRFAAQELSRVLTERTGRDVLITEGETKGISILLNRTGAVDALPVPDEKTGPDSREAYTLKVATSGVEIRSRSSAGIFYGVQTLRQLLEGEGSTASLPEVEIQDWPALAYRGTMVDMSHGPLPTEEEVKRQLDFLARWKANQYFFYTEASIEMDGYPLLNPEGRFTKEQVRRIIEYARQRHMDVIPNLEFYGHLHDLLRVEKYSDLGPFPHGGELNPRNPKVLPLLEDWANQIVALFPSPFVHIGFDETWQIEMAAKKEGSGATPAKLFRQQLNNVSGFFTHHGRKVMAWGDIIVKYPEIVADLPPGLIGVAWEYDPQADYRHWLDPLVAKGVPHILQTAVSNWREIVPDYDYTFGNIDNFLAAGRQSYPMGFLNSVWSDSSQSLMRAAWPAFAYGAIAPWQAAPIDRARFFQVYCALLYPPRVAPAVAAGLEKLNQAELQLQKVLGQETVHRLWEDPFEAGTIKKSSEQREDLIETRLLAEEAQEHFYQALKLKGDPATIASLLIGARMLDYAGLKFLSAVELVDRWKELGPKVNREMWWNHFESEWAYQSHGHPVDLMDQITELRRLYRNAWLEEYTSYRLESTLGRWDAEYEYWRRLQANLRSFTKTLNEGGLLSPLDRVIQGRWNSEGR